METESQRWIWPISLFLARQEQGEDFLCLHHSYNANQSQCTMQIFLTGKFGVPSSFFQNVVFWNWYNECGIHSCLIAPTFHTNDYQLIERCNIRTRLPLCCQLRSGLAPSLFQARVILLCLNLKTASGSDTRISLLCLIKFLSNTPGSCWCPESLMMT